MESQLPALTVEMNCRDDALQASPTSKEDTYQNEDRLLILRAATSPPALGAARKTVWTHKNEARVSVKAEVIDLVTSFVRKTVRKSGC